MTKLLAIDTSLDYCSAALLQGDDLLLREQLAPRQQAQLILSMIENLLLEADITLHQLDAIAFAGGPASFTGIRIAASTTQALAYAASLPVVRVSSLQTIAQQVYSTQGNRQVLVALDALMGEVYWGADQDGHDDLMVSVAEDDLLKPENVTLPDGNWVGVGNAWKKYTHLNQPDTIYPEKPSAKYVAQLAKKQFENHNVLSPEQAIPVYLRGKEAWVTQGK